MNDMCSARKPNALTVSKVTQTNIPPKETVTYCKETQTPKEVIEKEGWKMLPFLYLISQHL